MVETAAPPAGPATDARGVPVIDPTLNVVALVEAAMKRQDDLREMQAAHDHELRTVRADFEDKLRVAESRRIDAILAGMADTARRTAEQVALTAETLRIANETTSANSREQTTLLISPLSERVAQLERNQFTQQGEKAAQTETKGNSQWAVGFALSGFVALLSLVGLVVVLASH